MSTVRLSKTNLKLFPDHIQAKEKLIGQDQRVRLEICKKMKEDEDWIGNVWFSDERLTSILMVMSIKRTVFSGELNYHKKFYNGLGTAQRLPLSVQ